ncbi:prestin-like [Ciona intestinalis]
MENTVLVSRPTYSSTTFQQTYETIEKNNANICSRLKLWFRLQMQCSFARVWRILVSFLPVLGWLPKYKKKYIVGDCIAGWTVGIIRIPQGMAYALLAGVQPVYGLYSCFFPVLLWFVFSTSKHTSVGTMAVVCLMIQNLVDLYVPDVTTAVNGSMVLVNGEQVDWSKVDEKYVSIDESNQHVINGSWYLDDFLSNRELEKVQVASSATLLVGLMQLLMAMLRLGFLTTLLSDPVIQGFTTGSAFHVMMSQLKYMFGLAKSVGKHSGAFALFKTLGDILSNLYHANVTDIIICVISVPILIIVKYINDRYKKELKNIPIPIELILVVIATVISYFCHFDDPPYNVNIVKTIPTGFPSFSTPTYIHLWPEIISDCLIMAFISVAISLSLTKIYSDKHGYDIDANQEILALGVCNTIPAFLSSFAVAASLSRTAIQESTGGKTQLVAILSSILMLVVLIWLAPLFQPVPKSLLACIIIVAMKSLFMQFGNLKELWRVSKIDFIIWIVTCASVIALGVDLGLAVGVVSAIAALVYRIQHPKHAVLGRIMYTDIYADRKKYKDAYEIPGVKIFHYADSISFTNKDAFRNSLYKAVGCNPSTVLAELQKAKKGRNEPESTMNLIPKPAFTTTRVDSLRVSSGSSTPAQEDENVRRRSAVVSEEIINDQTSYSILGFNILIMDATMWSFVDSTAAREIIQIISKFQALDVAVLIAGPSANVLSTLDESGLSSHVTHRIVFKHVRILSFTGRNLTCRR